MARWLIPGVIIGAVLAGLGLAGFEAMRPATKVRVSSVVVVARASGSVGSAAQPDGSGAPSAAPARWVQAPGWIEPDPQPVVAPALRDGIIEEVLVLEGDRVERGAPVARLESRGAELELARAKAELARAESDRQQAISLAENARAEDAQLPFMRAALQARSDAARDASERADRLAESNAMGEAEVVRLRQAMLEARADLEAIEPRQRAITAAIRAAEATAASATLVAQAMLDEAALAFERSTVLSPIDGVVMEVHATPGENRFSGDMALGRAIVTLYDPRKLRVRADVPLADAAGLALGQRARISIEVLPDRTFDGVITRLVHKADIQKNTVGVKVTLLDPSPELKPDMLARVRIEVTAPTAPSAPTALHGGSGAAVANGGSGSATAPAGGAISARRSLAVLASALLGDGAERSAFVVTGVDRGRGRLESRRVRVTSAPPRDGWLTVLDGLSAGDRVVIEPSPSLADGSVVVIAETLFDSTEAPYATR